MMLEFLKRKPEAHLLHLSEYVQSSCQCERVGRLVMARVILRLRQEALDTMCAKLEAARFYRKENLECIMLQELPMLFAV